MKTTTFALLISCLLLGSSLRPQSAFAQQEKKSSPALTVTLNAEQVPHLQPWGEQARELMIEWHPRLSNMLSSKGFEPATEIHLMLKKTEKGVAATSGRTITVSSHWIESRPEDIGLIIHEQIHVIQGYPSGNPWWITEGIADYLRWAIYEGKPQSWFPRPKRPQGYQSGYQVMGGFLLWLETERAPGIVRKLNTAMRKKAYNAALFEAETGLTLDELWDRYVNEK